MNDVPSLSRFTLQDATMASADVPPIALQRSQGAWCELLRPGFVEKAVITIDFILIVAASLVCSYSYDLIVNGDLMKVMAFVGVSIIVAANFAAIMAARRNYRLKGLTLFPKQARDAIVIWSGSTECLLLWASR